MGKTKRFEIYDREPHGTTFEDVSENDWAGSKNKKKSARFGVETKEPDGTTFIDKGSHIDFPKADRAPLLGLKVIAESGGQGKYTPPTSTLPDATKEDTGGGSIAIGKSSPKHGKMKIKQDFRK